MYAEITIGTSLGATFETVSDAFYEDINKMKKARQTSTDLLKPGKNTAGLPDLRYSRTRWIPTEK